MDIYVQKDGQQLGPFPEMRIRHGIDAGEFAPTDLSWTKGKASWQPLASLINLDMTQPPPIHVPALVPSSIDAEVKAEIQQPPPIPHRDEPSPHWSRNRANAEHVDGVTPANGPKSKPTSGESTTVQILDTETHGEKVLYEDAKDFDQSFFVDKWFGCWMHSPRVLVTDRRFKVDDNSVSLQKAESISLETTLRNGGVGKAVQAGLLGIGALIMVCPALTLTFQHDGVGTASNWLTFILLLALLWAIPVALFFAMNRMWTQHTRRRFWEAVILLSGSQGNSRTLIASFEQSPGPVDRWLLLHINGVPKENVEASLEARRQRFKDSMRRIEEISQALEKSLFGKI